MEHEKSPRPRSVVGPVILILIGVIFLANNLGFMGWDVWSTLWRLWPVLLIAAGVDIMFGRNHNWGGWVAAGLVVAVVAGTLIFAPVFVVESGRESVQQIAEPVGSATRAQVEIAPGIGHLVVREARDGTLLAEGQIERFQGEQLRVSHSGTGGSARLSIKSGGVNAIPVNFNGSRRWEIGLNGSLPIDLDLELGVGRSDLDLTRLNLSELKVNTGVGETTITLPVTGRFPARIEAGVGKSTIIIPRELGARIQISQGLGAINLQGGFRSDGGTKETLDYATAQSRVELRINGGVGAVDVIKR